MYGAVYISAPPHSVHPNVTHIGTSALHRGAPGLAHGGFSYDVGRRLSQVSQRFRESTRWQTGPFTLAGSTEPLRRAVAVDWSGAMANARSKIWLAEACDGHLVRLESGRNRDETIAHLIADAEADPEVVVGLDFAFSFPIWFKEELGALSICKLWSRVDENGEKWLRDCPHPFWGRAGKPKPDLPEHFRLTEECAREQGVSPKSVFQIGGAGAVGTGSIRGMPHLSTLRKSGFGIWPFQEARPPSVIEIYPRLLTGRVTKADFDARWAYLNDPPTDFGEIDASALRCKAASSEDAFDAAVSAMVMSRHLDEISALTAATDARERAEGRIWWPDPADTAC